MLRKIVLVLLVLVVIYAGLVRPWILRMGATDEDLEVSMPGSQLVVNPTVAYTQAITIDAPREYVWPYLVQVGYRRAGWYNWDAFNRLAGPDYFYEGNKSADRVISELQQVSTGDKIFLTPYLGMAVEQIVPDQILMLTAKEQDRYLIVWTYLLLDTGYGSTRLLVRWTGNQNEGLLLKTLNYLFVEPGGAGIQQSLMLKGIKYRAERDYQQNTMTRGF